MMIDLILASTYDANIKINSLTFNNFKTCHLNSNFVYYFSVMVLAYCFFFNPIS